MNISILSSSHNYNDDRLYYHFSKSLSEKGHSVNIVSSDADMNISGKISISSFNGFKYTRAEKIELYLDKLSKYKPDVIICLEPITIIAAKKYSKSKGIKIIYDITEWYPSKSQLKNHFIVFRPFYFLVYFFLFIYTCFLTDGFVYGEYFKGLIPKNIFSRKKITQISYYPKKDYIKYKEPNINNNLLRLCYTGKLSIEKGLINFLDVLKELINNNSNLNIDVKLIGEFSLEDKEKCLNQINELDKKIRISFFKFQELTKYIQLIHNTDIFLDLRSLDWINSHSLPIKLFYFMGLQRPVIYSDLKAIRKEVEIESFGYLVNPKNSKKIAELIHDYQKNKNVYIAHCTNARSLFELKYNWKIIEEKFIAFVESFKS